MSEQEIKDKKDLLEKILAPLLDLTYGEAKNILFEAIRLLNSNAENKPVR